MMMGLLGAVGAAGGGAITDPNLSSVKLLLGFEGTNGSTGAPGMTDESGSAHGTATVSGTMTISTAQFKFGASSLSTSTSGVVTWADNADWHLGSGNFTVEAFIRTVTIGAGTRAIIGQFGSAAPNLGWLLYQNGAALGWNVSTTGTDNLNDLSGGTLTANAWTAVCVDFDGTKYRMYKDGAMVASSTTARNIFAPSKPLAIGANSDAALSFSGFFDEARLTKGVARYASDAGYTVATAAFPRS